MGLLYLAYPFKVRWFREISILAAYPSGGKMRGFQRRKG